MSPVLADCVAKVTEQVLWNWNLKQSNRGAFTFESTFPVRAIAAVFAVLLTVSAYAGSGVPPLIGGGYAPLDCAATVFPALALASNRQIPAGSSLETALL
jgi:hypothetical protein